MPNPKQCSLDWCGRRDSNSAPRALTEKNRSALRIMPGKWKNILSIPSTACIRGRGRRLAWSRIPERASVVNLGRLAQSVGGRGFKSRRPGEPATVRRGTTTKVKGLPEIPRPQPARRFDSIQTVKLWPSLVFLQSIDYLYCCLCVDGIPNLMSNLKSEEKVLANGSDI